MKNYNIAICCIAYNRINSLKRLLLSLEDAYYEDKVTLIISIDRSNNDVVERFADEYYWKYGEKRVIKHVSNLGLRKHVLSCGDLLDEFDALVVLEDDITVAASFYTYVRQCVAKYFNDDNCAGISLYTFQINYQTYMPFTPLPSDSDVYLMNCSQSWGQVWMKNQWFEFRKWYDKHNEEFGELPHLPRSICRWPKSSWLKYHTRYCIEESKYFVYPYISLSTNNGDAGTHVTNSSNLFQSPLLYGIKNVYNLNPIIRYDGFFENVGLSTVLNIDSSDLCVDLYGEKGNRECKRYWLSTTIQNYKILRSFALALKPWEANILKERDGNEIFLYDTHEECPNKISNNNSVSLYYFPISKEQLISLFKLKILNKLSLLKNKIC